MRSKLHFLVSAFVISTSPTDALTLFSIRLLFSIADIDSPTETFEEGVEGAEGEEGEAPEPNAEVTYPLRTSITITKVGSPSVSWYK